MPTKPFDAAGFAKRLNPAQQKDFAALNRNTGGNFANFGGEAGLMKRYGVNSRPTPPMAPPVTRPVSPRVSPPGPGNLPPQRPTLAPMPGQPISSHGPGSGVPPTAMPRMITPPGPSNLPPGQPRMVTPPGPPNLPSSGPIYGAPRPIGPRPPVVDPNDPSGGRGFVPPTQDDLIRQLVLRNFRY